ncbi:hypothetical protein RIR_jg192.t1 [Rhizophagus irregularis DAOM 181602=DAOM 197198]|nr:hypothetical protein RIR_jg192.t1 [Rhizophagus irregularis DAOM 181602=DAOM 197198]CAB5212112.1 unnamed protein product [Rhizophagus irregularis]
MSMEVNIWVKKSKGYLEVTKFNDQHIGHECHPSASQFEFVPTLRKLPEEFLEEIRFLTVDNNLKTRIVAQAIVGDETQHSYEWVFQCVKKATGVSSK